MPINIKTKLLPTMALLFFAYRAPEIQSRYSNFVVGDICLAEVAKVRLFEILNVK